MSVDMLDALKNDEKSLVAAIKSLEDTWLDNLKDCYDITVPGAKGRTIIVNWSIHELKYKLSELWSKRISLIADFADQNGYDGDSFVVKNLRAVECLAENGLHDLAPIMRDYVAEIEIPSDIRFVPPLDLYKSTEQNYLKGDLYYRGIISFCNAELDKKRGVLARYIKSRKKAEAEKLAQVIAQNELVASYFIGMCNAVSISPIFKIENGKSYKLYARYKRIDSSGRERDNWSWQKNTFIRSASITFICGDSPDFRESWANPSSKFSGKIVRVKFFGKTIQVFCDEKYADDVTVYHREFSDLHPSFYCEDWLSDYSNPLVPNYESTEGLNVEELVVQADVGA